MAAEAATRMMAAFVSDGESGDEDEDEGRSDAAEERGVTRGVINTGGGE